MSIPLARDHRPVPSIAQPGQVEALATSAAAGDLDSLADLYERYVDPMFRYVAVRVGDYSSAEDIAQEVWCRVARSVGSYTSRGEGSWPAWLFTVARRMLVDHHRRTRTRPNLRITADLLELDSPDADAGPEEAAVCKDTARMVADALARLGTTDRECLTLRFFTGLSVAETARLMGKSPGAVKVCQHRALQRLGRVLPAHAFPAGKATLLDDAQASEG